MFRTDGRTAREQIQEVIDDKASSDLIRFVCAKMLQRDPVDAANELAHVSDLFQQLAAHYIGIAEFFEVDTD